MQPPPVVAGQLLQRTPSETDPALSKEDQVRRMFAPELEMEVRDKLCANIYGEDQLWEDLRREEQIDIDGKAELWARSDLNSVIDKVLEAEGRAKVAAQAAQKKSATAAQLHVYKWRCAVCGNSDANKFQKIEGNVVCMGKDFVPDPDEPNKLGSCGTVVQSVDPFEGSFYRKFEGEEESKEAGKDDGDGGFGGDISSIDIAPMGDDQLKQAGFSEFLADESVQLGK